MERYYRSTSPSQDDVSEHYKSGYEDNRLESGAGQLDKARSKELIERFFPEAPATVVDIGGGTGAYACWLAEKGYEVHMIDLVPLHVELAQKASDKQPETPLASCEVGDACNLPWDEEFADAALLLGPLYHLTDRNDRITALKEAYRVLKKGGLLMCVGISRFASALDGVRSGFLKDPDFRPIVKRDLKEGQHRNPTDHPHYFMNTFFHHPEELKEEIHEAGFSGGDIYGVEGPGWLASEFNDWWEDEALKEELITIARKLEQEPALLGISAHLVAVGRKE